MTWNRHLIELAMAELDEIITGAEQQIELGMLPHRDELYLDEIKLKYAQRVRRLQQLGNKAFENRYLKRA